MSITIDQIKSLRDATSLSISLCKQALEASNGDQEKAIEYLRKQGAMKAAKKADRATNEGVIAISIKNNKAGIMKLACETDFVAKNEAFRAFANSLAEKVLAGKTATDLKEELNEQIMKIGENLQIIEANVIEGPILNAYIHSTAKLAAIIVLNKGNAELAKDLCMQVAATNPQFIYPEDVSEDVLNKEKEIWKEQLKKEGKPEQIWDKIMMGKEKKFREENSLVTQEFVKDSEKKIKDLLGDIKVEKMMRITL